MTKLRKLLQLASGDRRLLLEAALRLLLTDLALRALGFARVQRWLSAGAVQPGSPGDPSDEALPPMVERIASSVAAAGRHHLYPMRCLTRSLVLQGMLARRGVPSDLRIGVRKDRGRFEAHAWVEHRGRPVAEREDVECRFASLGLPAR